MGEIVKFPESKKGPEMNPDDLELLIEQNEFLKYVLKAMNDIPMYDSNETVEPNYMELWDKVALNKKIEIPKPENAQIAYESFKFYFNVFTTGYDSFGVDFFRHLASQENYPFLVTGIMSILNYLSEETRDISDKNPEE